APASTVYSDDAVIAFMVIRPVNIGHVLVVPLEHVDSILYNSDEAILFKCRAILDDAGISFYEWWDRRAPRAGASLSISTRGVLALTPRIRPFMVRQIDRLDAATAFFAGRYAGERQRVLWTDADRVAWSELRSEFIKGAEVLRVEH
ncbi:hypothetical protein LCGC14_2937680, partial [marine sediment metagenome]